MEHDKSHRGNASQFFVAGELCRRGYAALVTIGNTPNTDILCSNRAGTKFVHIQVKTFVPGTKTCSVGAKAEKDYGSKFFWILAGTPSATSKLPFEYFVVPSADMARNVAALHKRWLQTPGKAGRRARRSRQVWPTPRSGLGCSGPQVGIKRCGTKPPDVANGRQKCTSVDRSPHAVRPARGIAESHSLLLQSRRARL